MLLVVQIAGGILLAAGVVFLLGVWWTTRQESNSMPQPVRSIPERARSWRDVPRVVWVLLYASVILLMDYCATH